MLRTSCKACIYFPGLRQLVLRFSNKRIIFYYLLAFGKIANTKFFRTLFGLNKSGRSLWKSLGLGNAIGNLAPNWNKLLDKGKQLWDKLKDLWKDFMEWIESFDPVSSMKFDF